MTDHDHENETGDVRYRYPQIGVVYERKDPLKLGRVKARIPGLMEPESPWMFPLGFPGGGGNQRGFKWVPPVGAEVMVLFKGGDPNAPYYLPAHYGMPDGKTEVPTDANTSGSEDVHALETDRFAVTFDDRKGKEALVIKDKKTGDAIEFDGVQLGIHITATTALVIDVKGLIAINAATVIINGRKVGEGGTQI